MISKTAVTRKAELSRQRDKVQSLQAIVEKLEGDFPTCQAPLHSIALSLRTRLVEVQRPLKEVELA